MSVSLLRTNEEMTEIYNKHADTVYRVALMMLRSVPEAEDATQTAFIRLMMCGRQFESGEHIKAWLIVTTQNICRDVLKSRWRTRRVELSSLAEPAYVQKERDDSVWGKITALDPKLKIPTYLFYYEGYKTEEISQMLGVNHATVRTRLRAAKKKLKLMIEEDGANEN